MNKAIRLAQVTPAKLRRLYVDEEKPMHAIAAELGVSIGLVHKRIHMYGIKARDWKETFNFRGGKHTAKEIARIRERHTGKIVSIETRNKIAEARRLDALGHSKIRTDGYISLYYPSHPDSSRDGYIMEHRYIMEQHFGRRLGNDEVVHHINGKRKDNRLENMVIMTPSAHMSYHATQRHTEKRRQKHA